MFLALPAALIVSRIDKPLSWWSRALPARMVQGQARIWALAAWFLLASAELGIAVLTRDFGLTNTLPPFMFGLLLLAAISGFASDIHRRSQ